MYFKSIQMLIHLQDCVMDPTRSLAIPLYDFIIGREPLPQLPQQVPD